MAIAATSPAADTTAPGPAADAPTVQVAASVLVRTDHQGTLVRDRRSRRTFRVGPREQAVLRLCDGRRSIADIRRAADSAGVMGPQDVDKLLLLMATYGIVEHPGVARPQARRRIDPWHLRIVSVGMADLLRRGVVTRVATVALYAAALASAVLAVVVLAHHGTQALGTLLGHRYLTWQTLGTYLAAVAAIGLVHELAHAVVLVDRGGTVFEMGFMFAYLNPAFYVDISGLERLPNRWERLLVWGAGIASQIVLLGPGLYLQFVRGVTGTLGDVLLVVNAVNAAIVLFNLLFVIKLDGYHVLGELLEVRDLRERALALLRRPDPDSTGDGPLLVLGVVMAVFVPVLGVNLVIFGLTSGLHVGTTWVDRGMIVGTTASIVASVVALAVRRRAAAGGPQR